MYAQFESWTYLRFLLPALAAAMVAVAALWGVLAMRMSPPVRVAVLTGLVMAVAAGNVASATRHQVFRFAERQQRGAVIGERLAATLPVNAVVIAGEHSGTMRYYTGRSVLRWDLVAPAAMPEAIERLRLNGYQLWVVLDDWEEEPFRRKFPALAALSLDYPPAIESAPGVGVRARAWLLRR